MNNPPNYQDFIENSIRIESKPKAFKFTKSSKTPTSIINEAYLRSIA